MEESRILLAKDVRASGTVFVGDAVGVKVLLEEVFEVRLFAFLFVLSF